MAICRVYPVIQNWLQHGKVTAEAGWTVPYALVFYDTIELGVFLDRSMFGGLPHFPK